MVVEIFGMGLSAPCRILHMTCEALGVEYKETTVDLFKNENKTPEFLKVQLHNIFQMILAKIRKKCNFLDIYWAKIRKKCKIFAQNTILNVKKVEPSYCILIL